MPVVSLNLGLLFVAVIAVLIFIDADRLRKDSQQTTGPAGQSAIAWALGALLLAFLVIPLYVVKRERFLGRGPGSFSLGAQIARGYLVALSVLAVAAAAVLVGAVLVNRGEAPAPHRFVTPGEFRAAQAEEHSRRLENEKNEKQAAEREERKRLCAEAWPWIERHGEALVLTATRMDELNCAQLERAAADLAEVLVPELVMPHAVELLLSLRDASAACKDRSQVNLDAAYQRGLAAIRGYAVVAFECSP